MDCYSNHYTILVAYNYSFDIIDVHCMLCILTAPSAPLNLETSVVNATAVRLRWKQPENENGIMRRYAIEYHVVGESHVIRTTLLANEAAGLVSVIGNLRPYTEYMFRMQAATGSQVLHWGNYTEHASMRTGESGEGLKSECCKVVLK